MTKTTEELKREMYGTLKEIKGLIQGNCVPATSRINWLEDSLESYLEAMRQEAGAKDVRIDHLERMGDLMRDGYMHQQGLTAQARSEADRERNRCQAFEFANKSAGEFLKESQRLLKEARESIKCQRQSIGQLKRDRNDAQHTLKVRDRQLLEAHTELLEARKLLPATPIRNIDDLLSKVATRSTIDIDCRHEPGRCDHQVIGRMIFNNHTQRACLACGEEIIRIGEAK